MKKEVIREFAERMDSLLTMHSNLFNEILEDMQNSDGADDSELDDIGVFDRTYAQIEQDGLCELDIFQEMAGDIYGDFSLDTKLILQLALGSDDGLSEYLEGEYGLKYEFLESGVLAPDEDIFFGIFILNGVKCQATWGLDEFFGNFDGSQIKNTLAAIIQ